MDDEYEDLQAPKDGHMAYQCGLTALDNLHPLNSPRWLSWVQGWEAARDMDAE